jgi:hypothetical protein
MWPYFSLPLDGHIRLVWLYNCYISIFLDRISGIMVSVLTSNVVDCGFDPGRVKLGTKELVIAVSQISM